MGIAWVVRVIIFYDGMYPTTDQAIPIGFLDCLRHPGGLIYVHKGLNRDIENEDDRQVFDIYRPKHISIAKSKQWADDLAAQMRTYGINAEAAPEWIASKDELNYDTIPNAVCKKCGKTVPMVREPGKKFYHVPQGWDLEEFTGELCCPKCFVPYQHDEDMNYVGYKKK